MNNARGRSSWAWACGGATFVVQLLIKMLRVVDKIIIQLGYLEKADRVHVFLKKKSVV